MGRSHFGNITKVTNGYRIRWTIPGSTKRGPQETFPNKDLARARLSQIERELAEERIFGPKAKIAPITIEGFVPKFMERLRVRDASKRSIETYEIALRAVCLVCGGEIMHQVTRECALRIREKLRVGVKGPVSAQTTNDRVEKLASMYKAAIEEGHALQNPFGGIRRLQVKKREFTLMSYSDRDRYLKIIRPEIRAAAEFTMETALRQSELFRMRKSDVFLGKRRVLTRKRKNKKPLWSGLTTRAVEILEKQMRENEGEFVWPWRHRADGFSHLWNYSRQKLIEKGLDPLWPHAWRHTCAATHAQGRASIVEIARVLGVTPKTAQRYMDHAPENWMDRGVERLERLASEQREEAG